MLLIGCFSPKDVIGVYLLNLLPSMHFRTVCMGYHGPLYYQPPRTLEKEQLNAERN